MTGKVEIRDGPFDPLGNLLDALREWTAGGIPQRAQFSPNGFLDPTVHTFGVTCDERNVYWAAVLVVRDPLAQPELHMTAGARDEIRRFLLRKGIPAYRLTDANPTETAPITTTTPEA